jgi:hypothetical protein
MNIIAKLSYWILHPRKKKKSIIAKLSFKPEKIQDALDQFRTEGYVEKLKTSITPESLTSNQDDLQWLKKLPQCLHILGRLAWCEVGT